MKWFGASFVAIVDGGCVMPKTLENECTPCRESNQCKDGGFCCPYMKKCVKSPTQGCGAPIANCNPRCPNDAGCKCNPSDDTNWEDWANPTCPDPKKPEVLQVSYQAPAECTDKYPTYRLTWSDGLVLVALKPDGSSADPSIDIGKGFECSAYGIFDDVSLGGSSCLKLMSQHQLSSNTDPKVSCATDNSHCKWQDDGAKWIFEQEELGGTYCMKDPDGMNQCKTKYPASTFQITDPEKGQCSDKWIIKTMKTLAVSNISLQVREEPSCDDCQGVGNFACATPNGCIKAPSQKVCAKFGKWCPSAPTPSPAACASHPLCKDLEGDCCPTKDQVYLDCCTGFSI